MTITSYCQLVEALDQAPIAIVGGQHVKEIINAHVTFQPRCPSLFPFKTRGLSLRYLSTQLAWYLRGEKNPYGVVEAEPRMWDKIKFKAMGWDLNSNYGQYIWAERQYELVIARLMRDMGSRQAIILMNRPSVNQSDTTDHICTTSLQFLIRDGQLILIVTMRSNDLWNGFCYDVPFFCELQEFVWLELVKTCPTLQIGAYHHNVGSLHIYEPRWKELSRMAVLMESPQEHDVLQHPPPLTGVAEVRHIIENLGQQEVMMRELFHKNNIGGDESACSFFKEGFLRHRWHLKNIASGLIIPTFLQ